MKQLSRSSPATTLNSKLEWNFLLCLSGAPRSTSAVVIHVYGSVVNPLQFLHMTECDHWATEMHFIITALTKHSFHFEPHHFLQTPGNWYCVGILSSSKLLSSSLSHILLCLPPCFLLSNLPNISPCPFIFPCCCHVPSQRTHDRANKPPQLL